MHSRFRDSSSCGLEGNGTVRIERSPPSPSRLPFDIGIGRISLVLGDLLRGAGILGVSDGIGRCGTRPLHECPLGGGLRALGLAFSQYFTKYCCCGLMMLPGRQIPIHPMASAAENPKLSIMWHQANVPL
jgi:hypothetical protein